MQIKISMTKGTYGLIFASNEILSGVKIFNQRENHPGRLNFSAVSFFLLLTAVIGLSLV